MLIGSIISNEIQMTIIQLVPAQTQEVTRSDLRKTEQNSRFQGSWVDLIVGGNSQPAWKE